MLLQLYLHFPFCKRKCFYCDFCSAEASAEEVEAYCGALLKEIRLEAERYRDARVSTAFLGGGTPSVVPGRVMAGVLKELRAAFSFLPDAEFTAEANPGTLTEEWLDAVQRYGVNRLSLGVQAAQDALLERIGRIHSFSQAEEAVGLARRHGVKNLSADLMFGLPGQSLAEYLESIEAVCALGLEHISAYGLILEEGTPLYSAVKQGRTSLPGEDEAADMYEQGIARLGSLGFRRYEISNFAREGCACRHNVGYWQGAWYLGLGVAAHSMLPPDEAQALLGARRIRRANPADRRAYLRAMEADEPSAAEIQLIGKEEAMFETMMLGLRMTEGVEDAMFARLHGIALEEAYGPEMAGLAADGLARRLPGDRFALTARGLAVQNDVLLRLMK